jgi:2-dehydro-3-deoxygalactonokinase
MSDAAYIAGGNGNLRLFLCAGDDRVLETTSGPGAAESRGRFAAVFDGLTAAWCDIHGELPTILCGMAGSAFGWLEAPYLQCPEDVTDIASSLASPRTGVHIIPGMRCSNPLGAPDVLRGEETQLLGALTQNPALAEGRHLVCLPGTHTKWVSLLDGVVLDFLTVPTGELFRMLCDHSVLVRDPATPVEHRAPSSSADSARRSGTVRYRVASPVPGPQSRIDQQLTPEGAPSWMSGLLIGADVGGALPLFGTRGTGSGVYVVGAPTLCDLYRAALARHGRRADCIVGDAASLAGLARVRAIVAGN